MYHPARKKLSNILIKMLLSLLLVILHLEYIQAKSVDIPVKGSSKNPVEDSIDHNVIDFDEDYSIKFNKKYDTQWLGNNFNKDSYRYTVIKDNEDYKLSNNKNNRTIFNDSQSKNEPNLQNATEKTTTQDYSVIPLELISTTENKLISILESTTESDLSVIPLSTTDTIPKIEINDTFILPSSTSTENYETTTYYSTTVQEEARDDFKLTVIPLANVKHVAEMNETTVKLINQSTLESIVTNNVDIVTTSTENFDKTTLVETTMGIEIMNVTKTPITLKLNSNVKDNKNTSVNISNSTTFNIKDTKYNITKTTVNKNISRSDTTSTESEEEVPIFTELDAEDVKDVPEDYYDSKDVVPTTAPRTDALSVIFGLAGTVVESVVESVAERVVPKSIFDLFKRMQRQNEALEAERLRSREENGGLGQFTRGIIKSISTGISKPLSQLVAGARDIGSLDTDRGFVASIASGVTSVANVAYSVADAFKDRVQAIYPGTVWCGDGRSATARSSDLGLFFFTDTCCRQHDACKLYIKSGETKYGLTNTGLFTRSHCSCDVKFRECLHRTNSLVSSQIGLTYFNVLGPQCFRRAHPIVRCVRRTRITGLKCEEYELDYTKPRMWQWFDNETF